MINYYFPRCPVEGNLEPVPVQHRIASGAVPRKCIFCPYLFEGACTRVEERYMHLDHGPCTVIDKKPALIEIEKRCQNGAITLRIPSKCGKCKHLDWCSSGMAFYCNAELDVWGSYHRSLDFSGIEVKDIEPLKPFTLKITSGKGYGGNAIVDALDKAIENLSIDSQSIRFVLVIEGDLDIIKMDDLSKVHDKFIETVSEEFDVAWGVYQIHGIENTVNVHIVQST